TAPMRVRTRKESKLIPSITAPPWGPGETKVSLRRTRSRTGSNEHCRIKVPNRDSIRKLIFSSLILSPRDPRLNTAASGHPGLRRQNGIPPRSQPVFVGAIDLRMQEWFFGSVLAVLCRCGKYIFDFTRS